jgi:ubiquitin-like protein ATG12
MNAYGDNATTTTSLSTITDEQLPVASTTTTNNKVKVHFVAVGSAPIMKKTKFQIAADQRFSSVTAFLYKMLKLPSSSALFLYCSHAFVPGPESLLADLTDCFSVRDELIIHYSLQEAWG